MSRRGWHAVGLAVGAAWIVALASCGDDTRRPALPAAQPQTRPHATSPPGPGTPLTGLRLVPSTYGRHSHG